MIEIRIPEFPLSQFVECIIHFYGMNPSHSIDRFLPDGNTEIIIELTGRPQYIYDNQTLREKQVCKKAWASGVRTEYISIPSGKETAMLVICFKKGMAYPFFPFPMDEMTDRVVNTDLIWGAEFEMLREQLLEEKEAEIRFTITENFLTDHYLSKVEVNRCVTYAVDRIVSQPDQISLGSLYDRIGYSRKHFTGMFKSHIGVTPKAYAKILRFQKAIAEIEANEKINWAAIAHDSGFYDQAHFIHDFKYFSGFTPKDYLNRKNGILNYVPVG